MLGPAHWIVTLDTLLTDQWDATEPSQNQFSFEKGDAIADLADANDQKLRCHNLVWYQQLPNWVTSGSWTNETLTEAMKNHITKVVSHYKGRCMSWDVVNEGEFLPFPPFPI